MRITAALSSVVLFLVFLMSSCATTKGNINPTVEAGLDAYHDGEVLLAYKILRALSTKKDDLPENFNHLVTQVTNAAENLIERFLEKGDYWFEEGDLPKALQYYSDVADQLDQDDPLRSILTKKILDVKEKLKELESELAELVELGQYEFRDGEYKKAQETLLQARYKAAEYNIPFSMKVERLIEESGRRIPQESSNDKFIQDSIKRLKKKSRQRRKARLRALRRKRMQEAQTKAEETEDDSVDIKIKRLLVIGKKNVKKRNYEKAILAFLGVLDIDAEQVEAIKELAKLDKVRKELVEKLMKQASEYFGKEDLESAAPLYRRVIGLDPQNIRAKEGLQMYKRFSELKNKQ
jgi:hypothetical protein